jgi:hypothetical protein
VDVDVDLESGNGRCFIGVSTSCAASSIVSGRPAAGDSLNCCCCLRFASSSSNTNALSFADMIPAGRRVLILCLLASEGREFGVIGTES